MEYWVLYLCSIADSVHTLFLVLGIIGLVVSVIVLFMSVCSTQCKSCSMSSCAAKGVRLLGIKTKYVCIPALVMMLLAVATPSTNSCYAIFGVGATLHYINNSDDAKRLPDNVMKAANRYLESLAPNDSIQ